MMYLRTFDENVSVSVSRGSFVKKQIYIVWQLKAGEFVPREVSDTTGLLPICKRPGASGAPSFLPLSIRGTLFPSFLLVKSPRETAFHTLLQLPRKLLSRRCPSSSR